MPIFKHKIDYDPAGTDHDKVGAYIISASGNVIDDTAGALDVSIANASIAVTASDLDIRDLTHVSDSVKVGDGTDFLAIAADGSIAVTDNGASLTVDNAHLTSLGGCVDGTELQVDVVAALPAGSNTIGKVYVTDGTEDLLINADGSINVVVTDGTGDGSIKNSAATVTNTAAEIVATPLTGRDEIYIQNNGTQAVYVGFDNSVTSSNGLMVPKFSSTAFRADTNTDIWLIAASGSQDVRVLEIAY